MDRNLEASPSEPTEMSLPLGKALADMPQSSHHSDLLQPELERKDMGNIALARWAEMQLASSSPSSPGLSVPSSIKRAIQTPIIHQSVLKRYKKIKSLTVLDTGRKKNKKKGSHKMKTAFFK